jgi:phosphate starvation-inducible PhoH-like protein
LVITGDESQKDINEKKSTESGLSCCVKLLKDIDGIGFVEMKVEDIQRDKIIGEIIRAFE